MNASMELAGIAKRINSRQEDIEALAAKTVDAANAWLAEVKLQGKDLMEARGKCRHGQWMEWLSVHCPKMSYSKANRYITVAANLSRVKNLDQAGSLREALALCDRPVEATQERETKQWPAYLEALGRVSKFVGYVERFPIQTWPEEGVEKLRKQLEPIARRLWPTGLPSA